LEYPPQAWEDDCPSDLDRSSEAAAYMLVPPDAWARMRSPDASPPSMQPDPSPSTSTGRPLIDFSSSDSDSEPSPPTCELINTSCETFPRIGSSPEASAEVTAVPDSCPEEDANATTAVPEDVEPAVGAQQLLAPIQVRTVAGRTAQPPTLTADDSTDSDAGPDSLFEHDELRAAQAADDGLSVVIAYCKDGNQPSKEEVRTLPEEARELLLQWESLLVEDDILYRKFQHLDSATKYMQLVLPGKLHRDYIERLHADLGHFGQAKTCEAVARRVYFPGWRHYPKLIVKTCMVCNKSQRSRQAPRHTPLRPMREFRPMAVLHVDLVGPIPSGSNCKGQTGFQYILSVIDSATCYLWLIPLRNKTADTVATAIYEDVIATTSVPSAILTDLGGEFTAEVMDCLYARD